MIQKIEGILMVIGFAVTGAVYPAVITGAIAHTYHPVGYTGLLFALASYPAWLFVCLILFARVGIMVISLFEENGRFLKAESRPAVRRPWTTVIAMGKRQPEVEEVVNRE